MLEDYFGNWLRVFDKAETLKIMNWLKTVNPSTLCPALSDVFKAFNLCTYSNCTVVFLGQDPYPQKGIATGILFGNNKGTPNSELSPSLQIIKDAAIDLEVPHNFINFDVSLESWAKQGVLMLNSALTCEVNKVGSHTMIWRPFISKFIRNFSSKTTGIIYVLFGRQAQTFKPYISKGNEIIEIEHPAYFARMNQSMPSELFTDINKLLKDKYGITIEWYQEYI